MLSRDRVIIVGVGTEIGFIEHLQLVTTSNYNAIANSHTSLITIGHTRSSRSVTVFISSCLITASNGGLSPSSGLPQLSPA
jgi:hypothetical protein